MFDRNRLTPNTIRMTSGEQTKAKAKADFLRE
jgi:hypothetical protein